MVVNNGDRIKIILYETSFVEVCQMDRGRRACVCAGRRQAFVGVSQRDRAEERVSFPSKGWPGGTEDGGHLTASRFVFVACSSDV